MSRAVRSLPAVNARIVPSAPSTSPSSASGTVQVDSVRTPTGSLGPDRAAAGGVLEEDLGTVGLVDAVVDVGRRLALLDARRAAALVGHAGRPDLVGLERRQQRQAGERRRVVRDVLADGLRSTRRESPAQRRERVALAQLPHHLRRGRIDGAEARLGGAAQAHEAPAAGDEGGHQYVSLPPERSNAAPVENVMRSLARNAINSAASSVFARRPIGTRASM